MKGRLIGYVRNSASDQELHLQMEALREAGCKNPDIYCDIPGETKSERPALEECLAELQAGDTLIVWRLDKVGKSMHHLIELFEILRQKGAGFSSICDAALDTTTASGEMVFTVFSALAQFEHQLLQENTKTGLRAATERGRKGGRKPTMADDLKVQLVKKMSRNTSISVSDICETLKISRATYYRYLMMTE